MQEFTIEQLDFVFPIPWPASEEIPFAQGQIGEAKVQIIADTQGCFTVIQKTPSEELKVKFQPILLNPLQYKVGNKLYRSNSTLSLIFRGSNALGLQFDVLTRDRQINVLPYQDVNGQALDLNGLAATHVSDIYEPFYQNPSIDKNMPVDERHFLQEMAELESKYLSDNEFQLIKASGIVRLLLIEGGALGLRLSQKYRIPVDFYSRSNEGVYGNYSWGKYRNHMALYIEKTAINNQDLLLAYANSKGGIHIGEPDKPAQKTLAKGDSNTEILDKAPSLLALNKIYSVILEAFKPLAIAINASFKKP